MKIRILNREPLYDYRESCKITAGKLLDEDGFSPKDEVGFWVKQIVANHSTMRSVRFRLVASAPKSVVMQIIRATKGHPQPEVESSRPDWNDGKLLLNLLTGCCNVDEAREVVADLREAIESTSKIVDIMVW